MARNPNLKNDYLAAIGSTRAAEDLLTRVVLGDASPDDISVVIGLLEQALDLVKPRDY